MTLSLLVASGITSKILVTVDSAAVYLFLHRWKRVHESNMQNAGPLASTGIQLMHYIKRDNQYSRKIVD